MASATEPLAFRKLEVHHRQEIWDRLGLPADVDYAFFRKVQDEGHGYSPLTMQALLSNAYAIARELPRTAAAAGGGVGNVVEQAVKAVVAAKTRARVSLDPAAVRRRLYRTANFVWYQVHGRLERPLDVPRTPFRRSAAAAEAAALGTRVFTAADVAALQGAAERNHPPEDRLLIALLFTTGLRIGAVAGIRWQQVLAADGTDGAVLRVAYVREKGGVVRAVVLTAAVRALLAEVRRARSPPPGPCDLVFGVGAQTLRGRFKDVCLSAGHRGAHCHPHRARHSVAHLLFDAGNSVAQIAKFLGHRSLSTTNNHYLRLGLEEVLARMTLPWDA
jgi:integrase